MYQVEVTIDGVVYPSLKPAAKALGCTVGNLWFARKAIGDEVELFGKKVTFRDTAFREESHFPGYPKNHTELNGKTGSLS